MTRFRWMMTLGAAALALVFVVADAQARVGGGFSGGSRGMRTFGAPPVTNTAPNTASPIQRSVTQPNVSAPTSASGSFARPGFFGSGLFGGLAAGFLGAGLFGLLFGHGFFGGLGGLSSVLGLILQVALVVIVVRLLMRWWQLRSAPMFAGASGGMAHPYENARTGFGANVTPAGEPLTIGKMDYDAFEQLLIDIQTAYSAEDVGRLRTLVTPEMLSYFAEDLAANTSRGEINRVENVKLLQGDLAEAWREGSTDYATVAMRFSLDDCMVDRATGKLLSGGPDEAT
ncbi:MAG: TIM44-like domain-containing protein, partial [Pseudolabrys sp.]|nr:TIM44-like domain-containing protein [Pseudolabrys sp.]